MAGWCRGSVHGRHDDIPPRHAEDAPAKPGFPKDLRRPVDQDTLTLAAAIQGLIPGHRDRRRCDASGSSTHSQFLQLILLTIAFFFYFLVLFYYSVSSTKPRHPPQNHRHPRTGDELRLLTY